MRCEIWIVHKGQTRLPLQIVHSVCISPRYIKYLGGQPDERMCLSLPSMELFYAREPLLLRVVFVDLGV